MTGELTTVGADALSVTAALARLPAAIAARITSSLTVVSARDNGLRRAVNLCRTARPVAVLPGPGAGPADLATALAGWRRTLAVVHDDASDGPTTVDAADAIGRKWTDVALVLCLPQRQTEPLAGPWALDEESFARRDGQVAGPELRALALAWLAPRPGTLVWDVAAGAGAVGVEAARLGAAVIAVERDPAACVRIVANANAFGVDVRLVEGAAPAALSGLPAPDAVFVGGGDVRVIRVCAASGAERIVVAAHELNRLEPARSALVRAGYRVCGRQLSSAPILGLAGDGGRLGAGQSAFLLLGTRD